LGTALELDEVAELALPTSLNKKRITATGSFFYRKNRLHLFPFKKGFHESSTGKSGIKSLSLAPDGKLAWRVTRDSGKGWIRTVLFPSRGLHRLNSGAHNLVLQRRC
jgi:hypothetical protein